MPYTEVMHKFKKGDLHSGSERGPTVTNRKQAIAIMLSEKRAADKGKTEYKAKKYEKGGSVDDDTPLPPSRPLTLPALKRGETNPPSPQIAPPAKYRPSDGERTGPSMMAKKGGPVTKHSEKPSWRRW